MDNLILSAQIILPLFLIMAAGYLCRHLKLFNEKEHRVMNNLLFRVFLPVHLLNNLRNSTLQVFGNWKLFLYASIGVFLSFALTSLLVPLMEKDNRKRSVMIQAICRGNYALFGIPLVANMFPDQDVTLASVLLLVVIPLFNGLSIIALEIFSGRPLHFGKILLNILKNPLIVSCFLGFLLLVTGLKLPVFVDTALNSFSKIASPFALFLLGSALNFKKIKGNLKPLLISVVGKLLVNPLIFLSIGILMGFRDVELGCLLIVFGAPTATSSYAMAQQMGGDEDLAAEQVVFTTAMSIVTVFLFIFLGKQLGFI